MSLSTAKLADYNVVDDYFFVTNALNVASMVAVGLHAGVHLSSALEAITKHGSRGLGDANVYVLVSVRLKAGLRLPIVDCHGMVSREWLAQGYDGCMSYPVQHGNVYGEFVIKDPRNLEIVGMRLTNARHGRESGWEQTPDSPWVRRLGAAAGPAPGAAGLPAGDAGLPAGDAGPERAAWKVAEYTGKLASDDRRGVLWKAWRAGAAAPLAEVLATLPVYTRAQQKTALDMKRASGKALSALMEGDVATYLNAAPRFHLFTAQCGLIHMRQCFARGKWNDMSGHMWYEESTTVLRLSEKMHRISNIHINNCDAYLSMTLPDTVTAFRARVVDMVEGFVCPAAWSAAEVGRLAQAKRALADGRCFMRLLDICTTFEQDNELAQYTNIVGHLLIRD